MKTILQGLPVVAVLFLLFSCSDKYKSIYDSAALPQISFNKPGDSMYIREKDPTNITGWVNPYLGIHCTPFLQQMNIMYSETSGKVHFTYRGVPMEDSKPIIVAGDTTSVFCSCDTAGLYKVDFFLTDQLGRVSKRALMVNCLANDRALPDLFLDFIDSATVDNWSYRLDATKTEKRYGKVTGYYFTVDSQPLFSRTAVGHWVFHARGEHVVSLYVADDLGLHSDTINQKLLIP